MRRRNGLRHEDMRERLRELGLKARQDSASLTLEDLEDLCTLVVKLGPTIPILPGPREWLGDKFNMPFEPIDPEAPRPETKTHLRQTHAMEYIAFQLGELVRLKKEEADRGRGSPLRGGDDAPA